MHAKPKKKQEPSLEQQYSELSKSVDIVEDRIRNDTYNLEKLKQKKDDVEKSIKLRESNIQYDGKWFVRYQHSKDQKFGEVYYYHIKSAKELILSEFGSFTRECEIDTKIRIIFDKPYERSKPVRQIEVEKYLKKDLYVKYLTEISEAEVKLQVKLAMHLIITELNSSLEHKLVCNVKELDAASK